MSPDISETKGNTGEAKLLYALRCNAKPNRNPALFTRRNRHIVSSLFFRSRDGQMENDLKTTLNPSPKTTALSQ